MRPRKVGEAEVIECFTRQKLGISFILIFDLKFVS